MEGIDEASMATSESSTEANKEGANQNQEIQAETQPENQAENQQTNKKEERKEDGKEKMPPLHTHPRWKEAMAKIREKDQEIARLRQEIEEKKKNETVEEGQNMQSKGSDIFSKLPTREFKSGKDGDDYKSYAELYEDIRRNIIEDLQLISEIRETEVKQAQDFQRKQFQETLDYIKVDFGDDTQGYNQFIEFAKAVYQEPEFQDQPPELNRVYAMFLKEFYKKEVPVQNKANAKISKNPSVFTQNNLVDPRFIRNSDYNTIAETLLKNYKL